MASKAKCQSVPVSGLCRYGISKDRTVPLIYFDIAPRCGDESFIVPSPPPLEDKEASAMWREEDFDVKGVLLSILKQSTEVQKRAHHCCQTCGKVIVSHKESRSRYCSVRCRQKYARIKKVFDDGTIGYTAGKNIQVTNPHSYYGIKMGWAEMISRRVVVTERADMAVFIVTLLESAKGAVKMIADAYTHNRFFAIICNAEGRAVMIRSQNERNTFVDRCIPYAMVAVQEIGKGART